MRLGQNTTKGPAMIEPGTQPPQGEQQHDELELDKQTIKDLDVNEREADLVKGGMSAGCEDTTDTKPPTTV
jgi:hypothetical protein